MNWFSSLAMVSVVASAAALVACTHAQSDEDTTSNDALTLGVNTCFDVAINRFKEFTSNNREDSLYVSRVGADASIPMTLEPGSNALIISSGGSRWVNNGEDVRLFKYEPDCASGRFILLSMCQPQPSDYSHYVTTDSCRVGPNPTRIGSMGYVCAPLRGDSDSAPEQRCEHGTAPLFSWSRDGHTMSPPFNNGQGHDIHTTFLTHNDANAIANFTGKRLLGCGPKEIRSTPASVIPPL